MQARREEKVRRFVTMGPQNREIAKELRLSEYTISDYLFHILDTLDVSSRVELVLYAVSSAKSVQTVAVHSRRRFAGNLVVAGADLRAMAQLLGHRTLQMVMQRRSFAVP